MKKKKKRKRRQGWRKRRQRWGKRRWKKEEEEEEEGKRKRKKGTVQTSKEVNERRRWKKEELGHFVLGDGTARRPDTRSVRVKSHPAAFHYFRKVTTRAPIGVTHCGQQLQSGKIGKKGTWRNGTTGNQRKETTGMWNNRNKKEGEDKNWTSLVWTQFTAKIGSKMSFFTVNWVHMHKWMWLTVCGTFHNIYPESVLKSCNLTSSFTMMDVIAL